MATLSSKDWLQILGRGALSALLFHGLTTRNPLFLMVGFLHQLPLFLVGLQYGPRCLAFASGLSLVLATLGSGLSHSLIQILLFLGPCFLVTFLALRNRRSSDGTIEWYPAGRIVAALTLYIMVLTALVSFYLLTGDIIQSLQTQLLESLKKINPQLVTLYQPIIARIVVMLPAFLGSVLFTFTLITVILAQKILEKSNCALRQRPLMSQVELPWWLWWGLAIIGLIALLTEGFVCLLSLNLLLVLSNAFLVEGLGIVHAYSRKYKQQNLFLLLFYTLMVVFGWLALPVVILGIFEPWLNLKERLCKI